MKVKEKFISFSSYVPKNGNLVLQVACVLSVTTLAQQSSAQGTVH